MGSAEAAISEHLAVRALVGEAGGGLSPHFRRGEFSCKCCRVVKVAPALVQKLEELRSEIGRPIIIASGYRCQKKNKKVGGAKHSQHMNGLAADLVVPGVSMRTVAMAARKVGFSFVLNEGDHVHVDMRKKG